MKAFHFQVAEALKSQSTPGGWDRSDVAAAVLAHAKMHGPERTALTLQRVAGWKTFENISPKQFGAVIANLVHEITARPHLQGQSMVVKHPDPKKGSP